jgi:phosphoesterase RecJ-like protein
MAEGRAALVHLRAQDLVECGYEAGDTEGLVNQALSISGVLVSAFAREDAAAGIIKLSFRSKGDVDVNAFARAHWQGGGHIYAAGGKSDDTMADTLARLRSSLTELGAL